MKKLLLISVFAVMSSSLFAQSIFKGLEYGMSKTEAKKEYKTNKAEYDNVDFGNGFRWRAFHQNFIIVNNDLVGILFTTKGTLLGLSHDGATSYLEYSRAFFEKKGYTVFLEPEYWQYPVNFRSKYGLLMHDEDKSIVVQLYPGSGYANGTSVYFAYMKVLNYEWFMNEFQAQKEINEEKSENSGF